METSKGIWLDPTSHHVPSLTMRNGNPPPSFFFPSYHLVPSLTMRNGNDKYLTGVEKEKFGSQPNYEEWKLISKI